LLPSSAPHPPSAPFGNSLGSAWRHPPPKSASFTLRSTGSLESAQSVLLEPAETCQQLKFPLPHHRPCGFVQYLLLQQGGLNGRCCPNVRSSKEAFAPGRPWALRRKNLGDAGRGRLLVLCALSISLGVKKRSTVFWMRVSRENAPPITRLLWDANRARSP
jgi:hypothetical protein